MTSLYYLFLSSSLLLDDKVIYIKRQSILIETVVQPIAGRQSNTIYSLYIRFNTLYTKQHIMAIDVEWMGQVIGYFLDALHTPTAGFNV